MAGELISFRPAASELGEPGRGPTASWGRVDGLRALAARAHTAPEALTLLVADRNGLSLRRLDRAPSGIEGVGPQITALALSPSGQRIAAADHRGLSVLDQTGQNAGGSGERAWRHTVPRMGSRSWAPADIRDLAFADEDTLWLAAPEGLARYRWPNDAEGEGGDDGGSWQLFGPRDGLPYADFTRLAARHRGDVWAATRRGLVHLRIPPFEHDEATEATPRRSSALQAEWEYRQGPRWLPADEVLDLSIDRHGQVWSATAQGVGLIEGMPMTLEQKATRFEEAIDRYHRRTEYGYIGSVYRTGSAAPSDRSGNSGENPQELDFEQRDSDNDGLWTSMYGAAECYAFAVTGDPKHRERAQKAYRALRFLGEVTRGGEHAPPEGFVARSILPTSGPDPNVGLLERDRERQRTHDRRWKILQPRWPKSADGRWYWKTDTSSDELDGHYFFYPLYYDLVADEEEKARVRQTVAAITDHLIAHDFALVDHDGKPTRWAVFGPDALNYEPDWWEERGLNSLSILSYLRVAEHITEDPRYGTVAGRLLDEHAYAANAQAPKMHLGPGTGNQSDDEMAFMSFYNLVRYEKDPNLQSLWAHSFQRYAELVAAERNPLFNFLYAAVAEGIRYRDAFEDRLLTPPEDWLTDAVDSLIRYPLDRFNWPLENSHRLDVTTLRDSTEERPRGHLRSGKVLPIDERFVEHWNHDPWSLDHPGDGRRLADGASFLLPYYLGRYYRFLAD